MKDRDCEMHEFILHSATKYKDGTPIMSEPKTDIDSSYPKCKAEKNALYGKTAEEMFNEEASNQLDYLERAFKGFAKTQDELIEEYDATLKIHGDTLEEHLERICNLENIYESVLDDLCAMRDRLCKITDLIVGQDRHAHIFSNFCGNCMHAEMKDGICDCELSGEIVDPDSASCSLFDPSYESRKWFENMKKTMTTPAEPTAGCKDCNCAKNGMCTKYNCSLGAVCATPECFEPPF